MKKMTLLCPVSDTQEVMDKLHEMGVMEVVDVFDRYQDAEEKLTRQEVSTESCDSNLQRLNLIIGLLDNFAPVKKSFIQGLAPVPLLVDPDELEKVKANFDLDRYYEEAEKLDSKYRRVERSLSEVESRLKDLRPLEALPFPVDSFHKIKSVTLRFGSISKSGLESLQADTALPALAAFEEVKRLKLDHGGDGESDTDKRWIVTACLPESQDSFDRCLADHGFLEITLPNINGTVHEMVKHLKEERHQLQERICFVASETEALAEHRHSFLLLRSYWEDRRKLSLAQTQSAVGKWVQMVTGFIREVDVPSVESMLKSNFSGASLFVESCTDEDNPPVNISLSPMIRPAQMLVDLFGRPAYNTFDPSPLILPTFLIFFGICFGDVAYGSMLVLLSLYIMRKTKAYEGVYNFARLLFYSGLSTMFFGFILGSFFGDLYAEKYLGENNLLLQLMTTTQILDPLQKPIVALLASVAIGIANQFYGIALKMYDALQRGDKIEAFCDGLLWLIILPGFSIVIAKMFAPIPSVVFNIGLLLFIGGALGLILTQGRDAEGIPAKLITGVISLYGIVGSYGLTAFIGDTMSYCRLLALSLTTTIVALSFNMMADLLRPIPYVGAFLFVFILIVAHIFNFLINVLGAFVHSMRLIFVEFFGRFYTTGSKPFSPLGFDSKNAILHKQR